MISITPYKRRGVASKRHDFNNTVQAKRSAVIGYQNTSGVSERRDFNTCRLRRPRCRVSPRRCKMLSAVTALRFACTVFEIMPLRGIYLSSFTPFGGFRRVWQPASYKTISYYTPTIPFTYTKQKITFVGNNKVCVTLW